MSDRGSSAPTKQEAEAEPSGLQLVHGLADKEGVVEAPTDIALAGTKVLELPQLTWKNYGVAPAKLVITNTGHTVNVGGKWESNRSYLRDGPFKGQYVFAQMHFHWGPDDDTGSEHSVDGAKLPMELHVVHINRVYRTQELALKENDGVAILIYLFQLQDEDNSDLTPIVEALPMVTLPQTSTTIEPMAIEKVLVPFQKDYFLYWGAVSSATCKHRIMWLTCRTPLGISSAQLAQFRQIRDVSGQYMVKNFRETHPRTMYTLFHVNPSSKLEATLLALYPGHALAGSKRPSALPTDSGSASRRASGQDSKRASGEQAVRSPAAGEGPGDRRDGADGPADDGYKSLEGTVLQESSHQDVMSLDHVESGVLAVDDEGGPLECKASHASSICLEDAEQDPDDLQPGQDVYGLTLDHVSEGASGGEGHSAIRVQVDGPQDGAGQAPVGDAYGAPGAQGAAGATPSGTKLAQAQPGVEAAAGPQVTASGVPLVQVTPSGAPIPQVTPSGAPIQQVTPSGTPIPQVTPSGAPIPQVTPSGVPIPQATPSGVPVTLSGAAIPQVTPSGVPVPQVTPSGNPVVQTTPSGAPLPQVTPSGAPVAQHTPSGAQIQKSPSTAAQAAGAPAAFSASGNALAQGTASGTGLAPGAAAGAGPGAAAPQTTPSGHPMTQTASGTAVPQGTPSAMATASGTFAPQKTSSGIAEGPASTAPRTASEAALAQAAAPAATPSGSAIPQVTPSGAPIPQRTPSGAVLAEGGPDGGTYIPGTVDDAEGGAQDGGGGGGGGGQGGEYGGGGGQGGEQGGDFGGGGGGQEGGGQGGEFGGAGGGQDGGEDGEDRGWTDATGEPDIKEEEGEEAEAAAGQGEDGQPAGEAQAGDEARPAGGSVKARSSKGSRASVKGSADGGECISEKGSKSSKVSKNAEAWVDAEEEAVEQELGAAALTGEGEPGYAGGEAGGEAGGAAGGAAGGEDGGAAGGAGLDGDQAGVQEGGQAGGQPGDQAGGLEGDQAGVQPGDQGAGLDGGQAGGQPGDQADGLEGDQAGAQPGGQTGDQAGGQAGGQDGMDPGAMGAADGAAGVDGEGVAGAAAGVDGQGAAGGADGLGGQDGGQAGGQAGVDGDGAGGIKGEEGEYAGAVGGGPEGQDGDQAGAPGGAEGGGVPADGDAAAAAAAALAALQLEPPPPPYKFQYFQPDLEEQLSREPEPVFFNSIAVSPAVLHSKASLTRVKPTLPCHGKALKIYEEEKEIWMQQQEARQAAEDEALRYIDLEEEEWDYIAVDVAMRKREGRPADAEISGVGWPFDPYEPENPSTPLLSPIDVNLQSLAEVKLRPLVFDGHFNAEAMTRISNTGQTVEVRLLNPEMTPTLYGGPLHDEYVFDSMHFHWSTGATADCLGSVHKVAGQRFSMEVHMLHYRAVHGSKAKALKHQGGLCAVAFMLHLTGIENPFFSRLARELAKIEPPMSVTPLEHNALLCCAEAAAPFGYVTYPGTLVGREDNLNVVWIVYPSPIGICCNSTSQFQKLRAGVEDLPGGLLTTHALSDRPVLKAVP